MISSRKSLVRALSLALVLLPLSGIAIATDDEPEVFGWVEKATLEPWDIEVKAKLDSGALTSSLDARDIERFDKDGEPWVRFSLELTDEATGEHFRKQLERPLYRDISVRGAGGRDERLVVLLKVCLGDTIHEEQFGLRNREDMIYPLLLGRRTIGELGLLDVTETFMTEPTCTQDSPVIRNDSDHAGDDRDDDRDSDDQSDGEDDSGSDSDSDS